MSTQGKPPTLSDVTSRALIVRYREDTSELERALREAGFEAEPVTKTYDAQEREYVSILRGMLTHREAWQRIVERDAPALVVEADFVPSRGFERLPLPHPAPPTVWCWLYTGTSVLFERVAGGYVRGHAASPVATLIYPELARTLIAFADELLTTVDPRVYQPWDSFVGYRVREHGWHTFLARRSFGEHGGLADPEHKKAGLARTHRADVLTGRLAFRPAYAHGSRWRLVRTRAGAKLRALAKAVLLKRVDAGVVRSLRRAPSRLVATWCREITRLVSPW